jgi:hypothetical protein
LARIVAVREADIKILSARMQISMEFHAIETTSASGGVALHVAGGRNPIMAAFTERGRNLVTLAIERHTKLEVA